MRIIHPLASTCLLVPALMLGGCLLSASRESEISGAYVRPYATTQIKLHQTTIEETEELLGLPSIAIDNDDGSETWTWNWTKHTDSSGAVLILFSGSNESTVHESVSIMFVDGVAVKKWRD